MAEQASDPGRPNGPYGQIILFGDSITENSFNPEFAFSFGAALSHLYKRRLDVINRGFAGYNTQHALAALPRFMPTTAQANVELLIIWFGANDSCLPHDPTCHHVPVQVFRENLIAMIDHPNVQAHDPHILLVTPPPVDERQQAVADQAKGFPQLRRTAENTKIYADTCKEVGRQLNIPVVDIWSAFCERCSWGAGDVIPGSCNAEANEGFQKFFSDGLHLTSEGYKVVFEQVQNSIRAHYPSIDPGKMRYSLPPWELASKA